MKYEICAIIKDEHRFLKEWLDYHFKLGFNHITLFEDYGSKSHKDITDYYKNIVTLIPLENNTLGIRKFHDSKTQAAAYNYYLNKCKKDKNVDWVLFTDVDEFLAFEDGYDLEKLTDEFKDFAGIYLSWKLYSANGLIKRPNGGVVESYTKPCDKNSRCDSSEQWNIKSFVNITKATDFITIHSIRNGVHTNGNPSIHAPQNYGKAWLNHYFCKSWEDYCDRMFKRGNMSNNYRSFDNFFDCNPDLKPLREKLIESVRYKRAKSCMWISRELKIISGGNLEIINELNSTL